MKLPRRIFLRLAVSAGVMPILTRIAYAQSYPTRTLRLVVGFAGGLSDILARVLGQALSDRLGQQFIVENQAGAGTNLATQRVVRASPDGYTLLMATSSNAINATSSLKLHHGINTILPSASGAKSFGSKSEPSNQVTRNDVIGAHASASERCGVDELRDLSVKFRFLWWRISEASATTPSARLRSKRAVRG